MIQSSIAPGLLLAMPQLADPNFRRSVILMVEHRAEGSFGLVVNRAGTIPVDGLLRTLSMTWGGAPDEVIGVGGPVMTGTGWVLHEPVESLAIGVSEGTLMVAPGIALSTSKERLRLLAAAPPPRLRFLMGYAGWGPGQLQSEMEEGSWLHAEATPELVFEADVDRMWSEAVRSLGVDPAALVSSSGVN